MNEQILQIQEIISAGFTEIRQQFTEMRQEITEIRQQQQEIRQQITEIRQQITEIRQQNIEIAADLKDVKRYILKVEDKNIEVLPSDNEFGSELCAQALPAQVENGDAVPYGKSPSKAQIDQYTLMRMKAIGVKSGNSLTAFHSWYPGVVHDFIGWLIELYFKGKQAGELVRQKI